MSPEATDNSQITILYVEDDPDTIDIWVPYIKDRWNPKSEGVRSYIAARKLIEEKDFRPSFVIHDCTPLFEDTDDRDSLHAGDVLYAFVVRKRIPIVVISAMDEQTGMQREPYRSNPPICWLDKPVNLEIINEAVEQFQRWAEKSSDSQGS